MCAPLLLQQLLEVKQDLQNTNLYRHTYTEKQPVSALD